MISRVGDTHTHIKTAKVNKQIIDKVKNVSQKEQLKRSVRKLEQSMWSCQSTRYYKVNYSLSVKWNPSDRLFDINL